MTRQLDRLELGAEDLGDALTIAQRALGRIHQELQDARAREHGQRDLPLPGIQAAAETAGHGIRRAAILGTIDDLEDAIERGDAERAKRCVWSLRSAVGEISSLI